MSVETTEKPRDQLIVSAVTQHPDRVVQTSVKLWRELAAELISIIGEGGFKPLYARSVRLASRQYPWMAHDLAQQAGQQSFAGLQVCLQAQHRAQALLANVALFTIFLDLLASLIGEELTTSLLLVAWRQETSKDRTKNYPV